MRKRRERKGLWSVKRVRERDDELVYGWDEQETRKRAYKGAKNGKEREREDYDIGRRGKTEKHKVRN